MTRLPGILRWVALAAALVVSSRFEYAAGQWAGLGWAAFAVPVMVDTYAVGSLLVGRDVRAALALLWTSILLGAVHLSLTSTGPERTGIVGQLVVAAVLSTITAGVVWRVDDLARQDAAAKAAQEAAAADAARKAAADERARVLADREASRTAELELARLAVESRAVPDRPPVQSRTRPAVRTSDRGPVDVSDLVLVGRAVASDLTRSGQALTRASLARGLRDRGHSAGTDRVGALLRVLREQGPAERVAL